MEIVLVALMIAAGLAVAIVVAVAIAIHAASTREPASIRPGREGIEASILFHIASASGAARDRSLAIVRETRGSTVPVVERIDLTSWAEAYLARYGPDRSAGLLEQAVRVAVATNAELPLRQYDALVELTFALGFHSDALARIRSTHPFTHVDHARSGRPRHADRGSGSLPLFVRTAVDRTELLAKLGLRGEVPRSVLISTYRALAAQHHPDRFHEADREARDAASARFIEITEAYGKLLAEHGKVDSDRKL